MAPSTQAEPRPTGTRDRIVSAAAEGFARRGYAGTGLKAILTASHAPFGSLYHFFPGGKEELGAAAIRTSGATYRELVEGFFPPRVDVVAATREFFTAGAEMLVVTDYADACPIATMTLETASESEAMRVASAEVFESWLAVLQARLVEAGVDTGTAREIAVELFCAVEGAFLHCRATRTTEALAAVGRASTARVAGALGRRFEHGSA